MRFNLLAWSVFVFDRCAFIAASKIVGGQPAPFGRYPYMAGLSYTFLGSPDCGGVLIAPNAVLTGAQCSGAIEVSVGCYDLGAFTENGCESFDVSEEYIFPGYLFGDDNIPRGDFAVVILDGVSSNSPISYLPMSGFNVGQGTDFTIMGWGARFSGELVGPALLQEAEVDYISNAECANKYATFAAGATFIDSNMFCGARPGVDACDGDSGGPAVITCDQTGNDLLIGLSSWGIGCASVQYPGVYARVSSAVDFIAAVLDLFGHSLTLVSSLEEFCLVGGTKSPTVPSPPPTAFPTFPLAWTCDVTFYATLDGCDCECGAPDPDCDVEQPFQQVFNCDPGEICVEGVCLPEGSEPTEPPTDPPTSPPTPLPSSSPTLSPESTPTASPVKTVTDTPTTATTDPTSLPTQSPTVRTSSPTGSPVAETTKEPTGAPTFITLSPSFSPTASPETISTASPSAAPTAGEDTTAAPSRTPTNSEPPPVPSPTETNGGSDGDGDNDGSNTALIVVLTLVILMIVVLLVALMRLKQSDGFAAGDAQGGLAPMIEL